MRSRSLISAAELIRRVKDTGRLRLAPYLRRIADRGLLEIDDAESAAAHLTLLTVRGLGERR